MDVLTQKPHVNLYVNDDGLVVSASTNVAPDLQVNVFSTSAEYREHALGDSFKSIPVDNDPLPDDGLLPHQRFTS